MSTTQPRIQELIEQPREALSVEIKRWIDPDTPEGASKIVRSALALRNYGGGYLVIGLDDKTLTPDSSNAPADVKNIFHVDKIQGLVTKYASSPFEVVIHFPEKDGSTYVVVAVPEGVRTPVACRADLKGPSGTLLSADEILTRTLRSNNTPSTARAGWKDWDQIAEICFENREADIGRFLRRHLGGITSIR